MRIPAHLPPRVPHTTRLRRTPATHSVLPVAALPARARRILAARLRMLLPSRRPDRNEPPQRARRPAILAVAPRWHRAGRRSAAGQVIVQPSPTQNARPRPRRPRPRGADLDWRAPQPSPVVPACAARNLPVSIRAVSGCRRPPPARAGSHPGSRRRDEPTVAPLRVRIRFTAVPSRRPHRRPRPRGADLHGRDGRAATGPSSPPAWGG